MSATTFNLYRCEWCGRFYSSPLPEPTGCDAHIQEANVGLHKGIAAHNARLLVASPATPAKEG